MKKSLILVTGALILSACGGGGAPKTADGETAPGETTETQSLTPEQLTTMTFDEIFTPITPQQIPGNVFDLVSGDFSVITAGTSSDYNSMVASWGGWGVQFNQPTTWCMLRANRFTLEYMRREGTYTFCYFDDAYKADIMEFGTRSGRDTDKMKQSKLQAIVTPGGSIAYREAKLIIECRLTQVTTVSPDDFVDESSRTFVTEAHAEAHDWHKMVFGEITGIWTR
jgi:flavin reductase (DIM6/NTAB) family NADH-FMN oxidoreductase RutF